MADEKETLQQLVALYQLLQAHLEQMRQQLAVLQKGFADVENTTQAVNALAGQHGPADLLIPLGTGIYTHGQAAQAGTMLIEVGAGMVVEKTPAEILELSKKKKVELERMFAQLQFEEAQAMAQINEIAQQIQQING